MLTGAAGLKVQTMKTTIPKQNGDQLRLSLADGLKQVL